VIVVTGNDPKHGNRSLGSTTSASNGTWQLRVAHGFLYNTVVQASSGAQKSNRLHVNVHQVLRIKHVKFVGEGANGFRYKLTGSSASHIPGERITVVLNGKVLGKGKLRSDGTFTVKFTVAKRHAKLKLKGTGRSGSGVVYTLPGSRSFRV